MKDLQIKGKKVDEGTSAPDEEPNEDSDDLVRLFIWLFIRRWNDIHLPLHPPLKVLHPVLHPTFYPALKRSRNQKDSVYRGKYEDTYFRICQNLPTSQILTPKICILILSSKNTLAYKSDQVINYGNEAIRMGFRAVGYQLYRIAHLDRFAIRNNW